MLDEGGKVPRSVPLGMIDDGGLLTNATTQTDNFNPPRWNCCLPAQLSLTLKIDQISS